MVLAWSMVHGGSELTGDVRFDRHTYVYRPPSLLNVPVIGLFAGDRDRIAFVKQTFVL